MYIIVCVISIHGNFALFLASACTVFFVTIPIFSPKYIMYILRFADPINLFNELTLTNVRFDRMCDMLEITVRLLVYIRTNCEKLFTVMYCIGPSKN